VTRNETITLIQTILVMYPASRLNPDPLTIGIWHSMLEDLPGDVVNAAVMRMGATLKFPPSIADIRQAVADAVRDASGICPANEAWAKVSKAASRYGCYRGNEAKKALGDEIWHAVEMVGGWREVCFGDRTVISAQFERRYAAMIEQRSRVIQIPAAVNEQMARLAAPMAKQLRIGSKGAQE
jgi:hypothetical protein